MIRSREKLCAETNRSTIINILKSLRIQRINRENERSYFWRIRLDHNLIKSWRFYNSDETWFEQDLELKIRGKAKFRPEIKLNQRW